MPGTVDVEEETTSQDIECENDDTLETQGLKKIYWENSYSIEFLLNLKSLLKIYKLNDVDKYADQKIEGKYYIVIS